MLRFSRLNEAYRVEMCSTPISSNIAAKRAIN